MTNKPRIKMTIGINGSVKLDMSGFKNCSSRTNKILKDLDLEATDIKLKEEEVETNVKSVSSVKVHG